MPPHSANVNQVRKAHWCQVWPLELELPLADCVTSITVSVPLVPHKVVVKIKK